MRKCYTTETFIEKASKIHNNKYDYSLLMYKNSRTKIKIICPTHGVFYQRPDVHLVSKGCFKCGREAAGNYTRATTNLFIQKAIKVHGYTYDYSLVKYINVRTPVTIICEKHGKFQQLPSKHTLGRGCPKCAGRHAYAYTKHGIPLYYNYMYKLKPYGVECRRYKEDQNILEVKCYFCGKWFIPSLSSVTNKVQCIKGNYAGSSDLYCSDPCKNLCSVKGQQKYPKGFKITTSREVQPQLRKLVLKRDNYTCQICGEKEQQLHCHHITGIELNPIESADVDNCVTLCKSCHKKVHKLPGCGYNDLQKKICKNK